MNCDDAREARLDRASGPLEAGRERDLTAHLEGCEGCRTFAAEIDALESGLEATLAEVATVSVARRFRRSRWMPLAAAAACLVAAGLGWMAAGPRAAAPGSVLEGAGVFALERAQVTLAPSSRARVLAPRALRLERGSASLHVEPGKFHVETDTAGIEVLGTDFTPERAQRAAGSADPAPLAGAADLKRGERGGAQPPCEFSVEVREDPMKKTLGASVVVVGVVSGVVLLKMNDGHEATIHAGETAVGTVRAPVTVLDPVEEARKRSDAEKKVAALETELARSEARNVALEHELARVASTAVATAPSVPASNQGAPTTETPDGKVRGIMAKFDWKAGVKALVQVLKAQEKGSNEPIDPSLYVTLSQMNVVAAEIAKARGYANPWQAYSDPLVRETYVPAWLDALGTNLDDSQTAAVQQHVRDASSGAPTPTTYLGALENKIRANVDNEKFLSSLLRPDQLQSYNDAVGDNPWFGSQYSLSTNRSTTLEGLTENASGAWQHSFDLSAQSVAAAQALARQYAEQASGIPPVDPSLDVAARRAAGTQRVLAVLALQQQMEQSLAALPALTPEERARVLQGSRTVLDLQLKK